MTTLAFTTDTDPYVIYGAKSAGTPSLAGRDGLQLPQPSRVLEFASPARFLNGDVPVASRLPNAVLGMLVRVESASEAAHKTAVAALRAVMSQFTFQAVLSQGAATTTWTAYAGTVTAVTGSRISTADGVVERYQITLPVHPIEA